MRKISTDTSISYEFLPQRNVKISQPEPCTFFLQLHLGTFRRFHTVYQIMRRMGVDILENLNRILSRSAEKTDGFSADLPCFAKI